MSIVIPVLLFLVFAGVCITMDVLGWRNFKHLYWLISTLSGFVGNITFFLMMGYYNSLAVSQREAVTAVTEFVPYGRYAIVCAMFAFFLLGLMIFAVVFWIGRYLIAKEEGEYFRG